jgi:hypothetical protein
MAYRDIIKNLNNKYYMYDNVDGYQKIKTKELNGISYLENSQVFLRNLIDRCRIIGMTPEQLTLLELYGPVILKRSRDLEDFLNKIEGCLVEFRNMTISQKVVCTSAQSLEPFKYCGTTKELELLCSIIDPREISYINDDGELIFMNICPEDWKQLCSLIRICLHTNEIKNTNDGEFIYKPLFPVPKTNFQYVSNPGDGDCLFIAVGQFLDLERQQKMDKNYIVKPDSDILRYIAEVLRFNAGNKLIELKNTVFDYTNIGNIATFMEHFLEDPRHKVIVRNNWDNYKAIVEQYENEEIKLNRQTEITLIETTENPGEREYLKYCVLMREHYPLTSSENEQDITISELYGGGPKSKPKSRPDSLSLWGSIYEVRALSQYLQRDIIVYIATNNKDYIIPINPAIYDMKPTIPITIFLRTSGGVGRHYETLWPSTFKPVYEKSGGRWTKNTGSYVSTDTIKLSYIGPYAIFYKNKIINRSIVTESDLKYLQIFLGKSLGKLPANLIDYEEIDCYKNPILVQASSLKEAELIDSGIMPALKKEIEEKIDENRYGMEVEYLPSDTVIEFENEIPEINTPVIANKLSEKKFLRPKFIKPPKAPLRKKPTKPIGLKPIKPKAESDSSSSSSSNSSSSSSSSPKDDWIELLAGKTKVRYNLTKIRKLSNSKDLISKIEGLLLGTKKCSSPDKIINPLSGSCVEITSSRIKEAVSKGLIEIFY